jgi:Bacterial Ig domain
MSYPACRLRLLFVIIPGLFLASSATYAQSPNYQAEIHNPAKFDSGEESLNESPGHEVAEEHRPLLNLPPQSQTNNRPDGALQLSSGPLVNTVSGPGFEGVDASGFAPPDTNMAVGPNHIVQWVNVRFAIFNKSGIMLPGYPKPGNAFWQGFGGPCESRNDGDPIIQYDVVADRWIATQFTASSPYYQCFAISQTSDPTGAYYRYAYAFEAFPDYPKITVWKNSYLASYNMFSSSHGGGWRGPRICAYDRAAMLAGTSAVQECFNLGKSYGSLQPSDADGGIAFAPPSNTGYFLDFGNNSLLLWRFSPDFVTPANATLSSPITLAAALFSPACGGGACIPQPGGQSLDSLADRLMYRLAYRNFGDHESLVVNQSVTAGTSVGVRWYEIRNPLTGPLIYQQGTFAPDPTYRWMGSAAMDKMGNIAIGYSASSSTSVPSIRYTGRETTDPLNTLQTEQIIYSGAGSQTGGLNRWGDYSAMRIDPSDDCTFWYTNEYIPSNGSFNWRTRIASFKFNSCSTQNFSIAATPSSRSVNAGDSTTYTVSTTAINGYGGNIAFSATGLPSGATASFVPPSVTGTGSSVLTVSTTAGTTPAGSYTLTITGNDGTISHSTTVTLNVTVPDFTISASPPSRTIVQGNGTSYTISITALNGFSGTTGLTVTGNPANTTTSFNPTSVNGTGQSTLSVNTSASTPTGTYTLTVTGTSGSLVHTTQVNLVVQSSSPPPSLNVALASNGATAVASSAYNSGYAAAGAINGDRRGQSWGAGGGWNDATANTFPDWLEVDFNGSKIIHEIDVFTVQDNYSSPVEPTPSTMFTLYGITDFQVQYSTGSQWLDVPSGVVTGNNLVWRQFLFADITTTRIRVLVNGALNAFSRITEVEAYGTSGGNSPPTVVLNTPADGARFTEPATVSLSATANDSDGSINRVDFYDGTTLILTSPSSGNPYTATWNNVAAGVHTLTAVATDNLGATATSSAVTITVTPPGINVALASNGGVATASSVYNSGYGPEGANNGDRKGLQWASGGGWNDATANAFPDWLEVDFNGSKVIREIDVFTLQDNYSSPVEPTPSTTFTLFGLTDFQVQYWNGSQWLNVPGGVVSGNNLVWRQFLFADIATTRIRVLVNGALASFSRIAEVEAYGTP